MRGTSISLLSRAFIAVLLISLACVEPYEKNLGVSRTVFIVDAKLSDDMGNNYLSLSEAVPGVSGTSFSYLPVEGTDVKLVINDSQTVPLTELKKGYYVYPEGFQGKVGDSYQLFFTSRGQNFASTKEIMLPGTEIANITHQFDPKGIKDLEGKITPSQKIYLDTQDPPGDDNFYYWDWILYERQAYCRTCVNTLYYRDESTGNEGECRTGRAWIRDTYDYRCEKPCWEIIRNDRINIMKDNFSNGQLIKAREIANLPIYQLVGALVDIRQMNISERTYRYLDRVQSQGQESGGLADTPPITLAGNISSLDDREQPVAGYFIVGSVSHKTYWLDRRDIPGDTPFIGLLSDGRRANVEPMSQDLTRPPMAPCLETNTRTAIEPEGWQ